jgi:alkanesulfonate monooxygenase SsuD/methylene tetrahydromethanopterin reductase-like flavin-dependent oxidoreductase (luciferase family)
VGRVTKPSFYPHSGLACPFFPLTEPLLLLIVKYGLVALLCPQHKRLQLAVHCPFLAGQALLRQNRVIFRSGVGNIDCNVNSRDPSVLDHVLPATIHQCHYDSPQDAGAADLIAGRRLQLGISRGSPEQVIDGWRYFGYQPAQGQNDADMGRRHAEVFFDLLRGEGFAQPNPRPMFPNPPGLLRLEPHSEGLRDRIWWGAGSNATAVWAAKLGMNLQSSTLKNDETGEAFHVQQAAQIRAYHAPWKEAGHAREPRVSVSRSIFALMDDRDRSYFRRGREDDDQIGFIDARTRAIFGRSYAAEPDDLIEQLRKDEAIAEADTLLLTVPNQLGVAYNAHVIEAILTHVAPALGWR